MADAATLVVLVAAGAARDPTTVAMTAAARDALGGAAVEVRETRVLPNDEAALAAEANVHAEAVVEVGWADGRHRQATLRLHIATAGGRWIERVVRFKPSDAYAERGRTLGFAVASMLPEAGGAPGASGGTTAGPGAVAGPGPTSTPTALAPAPAPAPAATGLLQMP